tara:strand:+ start:1453 stop:1920 length:468 start_codon:yes stop_codon:yes gene_type:complete
LKIKLFLIKFFMENQNRKFLPTFSDLVDRLSICLLKSVFIPKHKDKYLEEINLIKHDINLIFTEKNIKPTADLIWASLIIMLSNRYIWENESNARDGGDQDLSLLKLTHSINGVRNRAKNLISQQLGERVDLKTDCLAAELDSEFQNWNIFKSDK